MFILKSSLVRLFLNSSTAYKSMSQFFKIARIICFSIPEDRTSIGTYNNFYQFFKTVQIFAAFSLPKYFSLTNDILYYFLNVNYFQHKKIYIKLT